MRVLFPNLMHKDVDAAPGVLDARQQGVVQLWTQALPLAAARGFAVDGFCAWMNTPRAQREADALGLPLIGSDPEVVARVQDKGFCARLVVEHGFLDPLLQGRVHVLEAHEIDEQGLGRFAGSTAQPRRSTSRRARERLHPWGLTKQACARLRAGGGAVIEPQLEVLTDYTTHWWIGSRIELLGGTRALTPRSGVTGGVSLQKTKENEIASGAVREAKLVNRSLPLVEACAREGVTGPVSIDLFNFKGDDDYGLAVDEINARFSVGFCAVLLAQADPTPGPCVVTCFPGSTLFVRRA